ncbi:MAG: ligase-associated DNA damage response DEXH box helicase [Flavobacteriales bacterium]|nr:ligase-associated DNA damage response DEXH box helicase [Flavobacteriales bacterium]
MIDLSVAEAWFNSRGWRAFAFQKEAWTACIQRKSGLLNAPTGSGKTYALFAGVVMEYLQNAGSAKRKGLKLIWVTPIRALTKDIRNACEEFCQEIELDWKVAVRTGDTTPSERTKQRKEPPDVLITTPESIHLLIASKNYQRYFSTVRFIVADEWHELMGSKRAVLLELALSRLKTISKPCIWGISATIGNMQQAMEVLFGEDYEKGRLRFIESNIKKRIEIIPIIPEEVENYPWAGHLGVKLAEGVLPIIKKSKTTLIFTNTRAQAEIWYQHLLAIMPDLAGLMAMHHGSISSELRDWVEDALHKGVLKCVVCTSSLDLGVDFRPVETIIQIGSPKGVSRFVQRAGRSGHAPGEKSVIYFLPTNALQLIECAALKSAVENNDLEDRMPYIRSFDVLVQYLMTLAVSDGFQPKEILPEIRSTFSFKSISDEEWAWALNFITKGGSSLEAYDEFSKVEILAGGLFKVNNRGVAMRHRLSIGAIVSDAMLVVKFQTGGYLGSIEEWFVSRLSPGDTFWFAGRPLELVRVKEMTVHVKISKKQKGAVPSWQGGRMPLSSMLSENLRLQIGKIAGNQFYSKELQAVRPIANTQQELSIIPKHSELLIEKWTSREGCHIFIYPFEGRFVHEGMASLIAYRLSLFKSLSFSIAVNDYGFELLSDQDIPIENGLDSDIFSIEHLSEDIAASLNQSEMARRRFRDISGISGLVFKGFPGKYQKDKHLQSSAQLFFDVFRDYEPMNLLFKQAFSEVMEFQIEEVRLRQALRRIAGQKICVTYPEKPTPFCFPILVERLREKMSTEKLEDRIKKMTAQLEM